MGKGLVVYNPRPHPVTAKTGRQVDPYSWAWFDDDSEVAELVEARRLIKAHVPRRGSVVHERALDAMEKAWAARPPRNKRKKPVVRDTEAEAEGADVPEQEGEA